MLHVQMLLQGVGRSYSTAPQFRHYISRWSSLSYSLTWTSSEIILEPLKSFLFCDLCLSRYRQADVPLHGTVGRYTRTFFKHNFDLSIILHYHSCHQVQKEHLQGDRRDKTGEEKNSSFSFQILATDDFQVTEKLDQFCEFQAGSSFDLPNLATLQVAT